MWNLGGQDRPPLVCGLPRVRAVASQCSIFSLILRPVHRTPREHSTVWRMLRTVPDLTSQLSGQHLRTLSKNVVSETWVKGSTGNGRVRGGRCAQRNAGPHSEVPAAPHAPSDSRRDAGARPRRTRL